MIERLAALARRGDRDVQVLAKPVLPDVLVERPRPQSRLVLDVIVDAAAVIRRWSVMSHFISARSTSLSACFERRIRLAACSDLLDRLLGDRPL